MVLTNQQYDTLIAKFAAEVCDGIEKEANIKAKIKSFKKNHIPIATEKDIGDLTQVMMDIGEQIARDERKIGRQQGLALGTGIGAGGVMGLSALKNRKTPVEEVKEASTQLIDSIMEKQACLQDYQEAGCVMDAAELALNQLGYSMFSK